MTIEYRIKIVNDEVIVRQSIEGDGLGSGGNQARPDPPPGDGSGGRQVLPDPGPGAGGPQVDPGPGPGSGTGIGSYGIVFGPTIVKLSAAGGTKAELLPDIVTENAAPRS